MIEFPYPNCRAPLPTFHTNCPDGSHFTQMRSHFAQNTTPNPCSLLSSCTPLSGICIYTKHPQHHPKTPLFLAWAWKWAKWTTVWAIWTPTGQFFLKSGQNFSRSGSSGHYVIWPTKLLYGSCLSCSTYMTYKIVTYDIPTVTRGWVPKGNT